MPGRSIVRFGAVLIKFCLVFAFISLSSGFQEGEEEAAPPRLVTLNSDVFERFSGRVHRQIDFGDDTLDYEVFQKALKGYMYLRSTDQLENDSLLTVIDFTRHCNSKRLWVIDLKNKQVVFNELVAHGKYSEGGNGYATRFSNSHRSMKSSLGFYLTGATYQGRNGLSLKLNGVEKEFNSNAYTRGIVIHGAYYVHPRFAERNESIGRSFGCPAVRQEVNRELVNLLKGASCLFIYHNTPSYNARSTIVNSDLYIPSEDLNF